MIFRMLHRTKRWVPFHLRHDRYRMEIVVYPTEMNENEATFMIDSNDDIRDREPFDFL